MVSILAMVGIFLEFPQETLHWYGLLCTYTGFQPFSCFPGLVTSNIILLAISGYKRSIMSGMWPMYILRKPYNNKRSRLTSDVCHLSLFNQDFQLSPWYIGPFKILRQITPVRYKLLLPAQYHIYPTFHVSLLKAVRGIGRKPLPPPPLESRGANECSS